VSTTAPGTPSWLRERNDRTALSALFEHGPLTRSRLGELTGMSKPTAAQMVARLEQAGLISPVGEVSGGRGPNAVSYGVRPERSRGVAIDIREHVIAATVVDALDGDYPVVDIATALRGRTPEDDVRTAIHAACDAAAIDPESVAIVWVGVQAAISADGDRVTFSDTLPGWPEMGARRRIADALGIEVELDNDVNLAAVAERASGVAADAASFALLWMGDGLGLAVDLGGTVHRGAAGGAGEIGYLPIPRAAAELDPAADDLTDLLRAEAVTRLGDDTDALAARIALGVIPVLAVLDPELVVLGGPTGLAGGADLAERVTHHIETTSRWRPAVRASGIASQPVLGGARRMLVGRIRDRLYADISSIPVTTPMP
jgi:predicted NBD/HSP70 family sugar kinase